jgi:hypothetical protein
MDKVLEPGGLIGDMRLALHQSCPALSNPASNISLNYVFLWVRSGGV